MVHLTLAGVSEDGNRLLLVSDSGVEFTVEINARLRAALRGDTTRLGQLEIQMDSVLRPRDIQARIRAGESPESVAQVAQTSVDKIMPYAAPVLAERAHVAQRAQQASLRGRGADGARNLGDAVAGHLRSANVDPGTVEWDAWRREDGRWSLTGSYTTSERTGVAQFSFDAPGNYVISDNADAKWLTGETVSVPAASDDLTSRRRRLSAVPADELPLGDDAIELVTESEISDQELGVGAPVEAYLEAPEPEPVVEPEPEPAPEQTAADAVVDAAVEDPEEAKPARRKGRASVPSWDEIMFGGGKND